MLGVQSYWTLAPSTLSPVPMIAMASCVPSYTIHRSILSSLWSSNVPTGFQYRSCLCLLVVGLVLPASTVAQCLDASSSQSASYLFSQRIESSFSEGADSKPLEWGPPWRDLSWKDLSWRNAKGRANLSTWIPVAVGTALVGLQTEGSWSPTVGLSVIGGGVLIGPSMGQWCLGGQFAREGILYTSIRAVSVVGTTWAWSWTKKRIQEASLFTLPFLAFYLLPVLGAVTLTIQTAAWTIEETPRIACDAEKKSGRVTVSPFAGPPPFQGLGVHLTLQF